jgi:hypothetical protein
VSQQDASVITTEHVPPSNDQEPQDDAPEDADSSSAKDAESVITKDAKNATKKYIILYDL